MASLIAHLEYARVNVYQNDILFTYNVNEIDKVKIFSYLGIVFTSGGSFSDAQNTLAGHALKGIFQMNKYLYKFITSIINHKLELLEKLILPVMNYGSEVCGFSNAEAVERVIPKCY